MKGMNAFNNITVWKHRTVNNWTYHPQIAKGVNKNHQVKRESPPAGTEITHCELKM